MVSSLNWTRHVSRGAGGGAQSWRICQTSADELVTILCLQGAKTGVKVQVGCGGMGRDRALVTALVSDATKGMSVCVCALMLLVLLLLLPPNPFSIRRRFYSNAYTDAEKQDAINLFLGNYVPLPGEGGGAQGDTLLVLSGGIGIETKAEGR